MTIGPNVRKLIAHKMSVDAIPPGGGLMTGVEFLLDKNRVVNSAKVATKWVEDAIALVRTSPDNPYKTDEEIAGAILDKLPKSSSQKLMERLNK